MNKVEVFSTSKKFHPYEAGVTRVALKTLKLLKKDGFFVEIHLISDSEIRSINRIHRNKDKATNVLSFEQPGKFKDASIKLKPLGEIFISPEFVKREKQSMDHMVVHGLLHLLGYDHETEKERGVMEKKEKMLLEKLL